MGLYASDSEADQPYGGGNGLSPGRGPAAARQAMPPGRRCPHLALTLPARQPPPSRGRSRRPPGRAAPGPDRALPRQQSATLPPSPKNTERKKEPEIKSPSLSPPPKQVSFYQTKPPSTAPTLPPRHRGTSHCRRPPKGTRSSPPMRTHTHARLPRPPVRIVPLAGCQKERRPTGRSPPASRARTFQKQAVSAAAAAAATGHLPRAALPHSIAQRGGGAWPFPRPARSAAHPPPLRKAAWPAAAATPRPGPPPARRARLPGPRCLPAPRRRKRRRRRARSSLTLPARRSPPRRCRPGPAPRRPVAPGEGRRAWPGLRRRRLRAEGEDEEAVRAALPPLSSMNGAAGPPRNPGSPVPGRSGAAGVPRPPGDKMAAVGLRPVTARVRAPPYQIGGGSFLEVRRWIGLRKMNELSRSRGTGPCWLPLLGHNTAAGHKGLTDRCRSAFSWPSYV